MGHVDPVPLSNLGAEMRLVSDDGGSNNTLPRCCITLGVVYKLHEVLKGRGGEVLQPLMIHADDIKELRSTKGQIRAFAALSVADLQARLLVECKETCVTHQIATRLGST